MFYFSTNNHAPKADFKEATIRGLAPDKGLYFPEEIPLLPKDFIKNIKQYSKDDLVTAIPSQENIKTRSRSNSISYDLRPTFNSTLTPDKRTWRPVKNINIKAILDYKIIINPSIFLRQTCK